LTTETVVAGDTFLHVYVFIHVETVNSLRQTTERYGCTMMMTVYVCIDFEASLGVHSQCIYYINTCNNATGDLCQGY